MLDFIFSLVLVVLFIFMVCMFIKDYKKEREWSEDFRRQSLLLVNIQISNEVKRTELLNSQLKHVGKED